jgi:hypothetical protein
MLHTNTRIPHWGPDDGGNEYWQCTRKKTHPDLKSARQAAGIARNRSGNPLIQHYRCPFCQQFHIGKPPGGAGA